MKITLNHAGNGDCILVENNETSILIDGGTASSYSMWKKNIIKMDKLDCVVVTHIDSDHVNGIIKLIESDNKPTIGQIIYNGAEQILGFESTSSELPDDDVLNSLSERVAKCSEDEVDIGVSEGTSLSFALKENSVKNNHNAIHNNTNEKIIIGDITLTVLSPTENCIERLKLDWLEVLEDEGINRKIVNKSYALAFEKYISSLEDEYLSEISDENTNNIDLLADFYYTRDPSLANETSLSFLISDNNNTILMLGDCHAETIISWLNERNINKLKVDAVKVSHHGSKNNINKELIQMLDCSKYLISTNGKIFNHPDIESLAVIAKYSSNSNTKIIINNPIKHINNEIITDFYNYNKTEIIVNMKEIEL